jgi:hypothetical protein
MRLQVTQETVNKTMAARYALLPPLLNAIEDAPYLPGPPSFPAAGCADATGGKGVGELL